jgi:hypothetical protein
VASPIARGLPPSHGGLAEAFLPACAICIPGIEPIEVIKPVVDFKASACSSVHIPKHRGVILPRGSTAVASAKTRPTPPLANVLRCANCQSEATPLLAEYIHSGDKTTLLGSVTPLNFNGLKSFALVLIDFSCSIFTNSPSETAYQLANFGHSLSIFKLISKKQLILYR